MAVSNEQKLAKAEAMLETIETTLASLYAKTASSTSFGDQSRTLASIADLEKSRDKWRNEIDVLTRAVNQSRRTLKVHFR